MTTDILSDKWRGQRAEPIDLATVRFTAQRSTLLCAGCMFRGQSGDTCQQAAEIAAERGLPDCDEDGPKGKQYIYVLDRSDERQIDLLDGGAP